MPELLGMLELLRMPGLWWMLELSPGAGVACGCRSCWDTCRLFRLVFCKALAEDRAHAVGCREVFGPHASQPVDAGVINGI